MIAGIHHAQVMVPTDRLDEAIGFYGGVLGLVRSQRPTGQGWESRGAWFTVGDRQLHLGVEDGVDHAATRGHVAYEVDDLAPVVRRLQQAGCPVDVDGQPGIPVIPGWRRAQSRDPFGNLIEFVARDDR